MVGTGCTGGTAVSAAEFSRDCLVRLIRRWGTAVGFFAAGLGPSGDGEFRLPCSSLCSCVVFGSWGSLHGEERVRFLGDSWYLL